MGLKRKQLLDRLLGRLLMLWLRPTAQILGFVLRRDHPLELRDKVAVIKMMGGGSLIIAYPALLALRKRYPHVRFIFIGTPAVRPFAELLSLFDEFHDIVDDRGLWNLIASTVSTLIRCAKVDTIIDLEIYSRLTTIFSALTLARNRIGFYLDVAFWREGITSHLFYFNRSTSMPLYYEQVARSLDAPALSMAEARTHFLAANRFSRQEQPHPGRHRLGLGVLCSEIAHERQLTPEQWATLLRRKFAIERLELNLFGSRSEMNQMRSVEQQLRQHLPGVTINNFCGQLSLHDSAAILTELDEFWSIDTGLLHIARLIGLPVTSFWGPTSPDRLILRTPDVREVVFYHKIHCSPCVHNAEQPPCRGHNICMQQHTQVMPPEELNRPWIVN
jgi:ADP-heptose:LPS heptosyltransferase